MSDVSRSTSSEQSGSADKFWRRVIDVLTENNDGEEQMIKYAYVAVAKVRDALGFNTTPMEEQEALAYAEQWATSGREAKVYRAAPVTPGLSSTQLLERHESYLTDDLLATFAAQ